MTQFGINQGNRSACRVGYAQSYKAKLSLSDEECMAHDKDVIGAAGIFWSLILFSFPIEVTAPVVQELQKQEIPHLASRYIKPGSVL